MVFADIIASCSLGTFEDLGPLDSGTHGYFVEARPFTLELRPCFIIVASTDLASVTALATEDKLNNYFARTALGTAASIMDFLGTTSSDYLACVGAFLSEVSHLVAFDWDIAHCFDSLSFYF